MRRRAAGDAGEGLAATFRLGGGFCDLGREATVDCRRDVRDMKVEKDGGGAFWMMRVGTSFCMERAPFGAGKRCDKRVAAMGFSTLLGRRAIGRRM